MYKRNFICPLICLWAFIVGSNIVSAQSQLAQDTYAIFEGSCLICHGADGAYRETLLMEHDALIGGGTVVPGNPNASELYKRLLGNTENGVQMPFGQPPLPPQSIEAIRRWIVAGAPDWATIPTTDSRFISPGEILDTIETHLMSLEPFDRAYARYFTLAHLYNAGETSQILGEYRKALYKLVNSLSWGLDVINPQPIDSQATIFYIDLRHYEWDRIDAWTKIEDEYPYHISFDAPAQLGLRNQLGRLQTQMKTDVPSVHVDWFIATASSPPLYHELLSLPSTARELELQLDVDVVGNLTTAPGVRVWRAGFNNSGVSNNNRVVERHTSRYGAYWKSYDFAGSVGTQNIFTHPLNFNHDGGEVIFNLPNGLQGYYLVNASGFRLDDAPINIVSNPAASDPTVRNGLSCIGCHTEGMKTLEDQVRSVIESNANPPYNKAQALRLYTEKSKMDDLVAEDMNRYRQGLEATGGVLGGVEPISRFHEAFQGPVDAAYAAAVVGLETEAFLERVRDNTGLQNVGLLALEGENGSVKRDTWTSSFRDVMYALDYPQLVGETPVITQPDVIPGGQVQIPDPNLRAAIAEELGKSPNAPITAEDMKRLTFLSKIEGQGIRDLTGLQFATNLSSIRIEGSRVSDLSPIAGLTQLKALDIDFTDPPSIIHDAKQLSRLVNLTFLALHGVEDLTPLAGLPKLEQLFVSHSDIRDLSPLAGLVNLELIHMGTSASDLSPLAGLTKLRHLYLPGGDISELTPLAGLTGLEELYLFGNDVADISLLARLTDLKRLDLSRNDLSDISPLAGLSNLKWMNLHNNKISDISALSGLTNLTWLDVSVNEISDFSPLDGLREDIKLVWHINPGYPQGGPKIEGPWLWVVLPDARLERGTDLLSAASGGRVTEAQIATDGATVGKPIEDAVWTVHKLPQQDRHNIGNILKDTVSDHDVIYGSVSLYSPRGQETTMYVGNDEGLKVWLNGNLVYEVLGDRALALDYNDLFPVTLQQGRNVLLVAVFSPSLDTGAFFGFEPNTEYTVGTGIGYSFSKTPIHLGDTFTLDIRAENVFDLAGWQFDIAFDPAILEAVDVSEGDFLKTDGGATFFQSGRIDTAAGKITGLKSARLSDSGVSGTGNVLQIKFKAKLHGETRLALQNFKFGSSTGEIIPAGPHEIQITVEQRLPTGDVNRDGDVDILDLILVAQQLGKSVPANSPVDINSDGVVNIFDLTLVAQGIGKTTAAAPAIATGRADAATIDAWIAGARLVDDGSIAFRQGIQNLQNLLASLIIPQETVLLANYPNPFNPETWIPYQLAVPAEVALTIYDMNGGTVRRLEVGHQAVGMYQSRGRAVYWDGRNGRGESVASGLYFYTLKAGEFTATRKMLVQK